MKIDKYHLHYSSILNKFVVINSRTGDAQSFWNDRRNAEQCIQGLTRMRKEFEKNVALNALNASTVKIGKGVKVR